MPISITPTAAQGLSLAPQQSPRAQQPPASDPGTDAASTVAAPAQAGADVLVSISAEARAAQTTGAPVQTGAAQALPPVAPSRADPVPAVDAGPRLDAPASATATPPAAAEAAQAARATAAQQRPAGSDPTPREPDAASTDRNQAVQMYLDNATRPDNQPQPSAIRASA